MTDKHRKLEGVIVPLAVPLQADGDIDCDGVAKLARWLVDNGADGLFVAGTTGRFSHFSPRQNAEACSAVKEAVGDRATIYGGACDSGLFRMLDNAESLKLAGADIAVVTGPYYLSYTTAESEDVLRHVAERSPLPVVYYNIPEFVRYGLRPEFLEEMAEHPNVAGYKDSTGDLAHHLDVLRRTKGKAFDVLIGKEMLLADAFKEGATGLVLSFTNLNPQLYAEFVAAAKAGNWPRVDELQADIARIVEAYLAYGRQQPHAVFSNLMNYFEGEFERVGFRFKLV
ncbi:dihydrodipicolinate synthase family protein [Cohnella nanjingensis]|uniref:Dihydrodipicolinate synthase family protein n=1 Tax=Cohnella nanjingensis TaxID=1387779 RepID=A0A7X0RQY0_9BACL|nr:dihydrodipicolinate synthase family protein [Cohnella nanjingensis]MBB6670785.1 dihydrodipicolinate synthase family protein [Cohnella nanjingensis]